MIRIVQRRLIIPQGDTGTFTIPLQGTLGANDKAILAIYDNLMQTVKLEKEMTDNGDGTLSYTFASEDTLDMEPDDRGHRYSWDIILMREPQTVEGKTVYGDVDSYYAAFRLPPCIIKRVTRDVQK